MKKFSFNFVKMNGEEIEVYIKGFSNYFFIVSRNFYIESKSRESVILIMNTIMPDWRISPNEEIFFKYFSDCNLEFWKDAFTNKMLDDYSCLNHLSPNVRKAVFSIICICNNSFTCYNRKYYSRYLTNCLELFEFYNFMVNIPEELKFKEDEDPDEYFDSLCDKYLGGSYI